MAIDTNLFNPDYTQGNLEEINVLADKIGKIAVIVISITGFGIVMATIMKNATHGLYAVFPKFWDNVDRAKNEALGIKTQGSSNQMTKVMGSVSQVLLSLLPNVKAMTDFDDEVLDAKAYFMKAIPLACVQIFIGVFIFFGYPARVAEKFSDFGKGMFDVVLMNVDPLAWVQSLPEKLLFLKLSTDGSKADFDICVNEAARSVWNTYVGELSDMTKDKRDSVSVPIEQWVIDNMNSIEVDFCDKNKYKMAVSSRTVMSAPDLSRVHKKEVDGIFTFAWARAMSDWDSGSVMPAAATKFIRYDLVFTPVASKGKLSNIDNQVSMPKKFITLGASEIKVVFDEGVTDGYGIAGAATINGIVKIGSKEVKVNGKITGNTVTFNPVGKITAEEAKKITTITSIGGLHYEFNNTKHAIKSISIDTKVSAITFKPTVSTAGVSNWTWGGDPNKGKESKVNTEKESKTKETGGLGEN